MTKSTFINATLLIATLVLLGKIFAFAKDMIFANIFGMTNVTDAYNVANGVTAVIFLAVYSTISLSFLPLYSKKKETCDSKEVNSFVNNTLFFYLVVSIIISSLGILYSEQLVNLFANGLDVETNRLSSKLTKIFCISFAFSAACAVLSSVQYANNKFVGPQLIPLINNLIVMIGILVFAQEYGIYAVAIIATLTWVIQVPIQKILTGDNFRLALKLPRLSQIKSSSTKKTFFLLLVPIFIGICVDQINLIIDMSLGSKLLAGSISSLAYSFRIVTFSSGIFIAIITALIFPIFAKLVARNKHLLLNIRLQRSIRLALLATTPVVLISLVYNQQIIEIAFERGRFTAADTAITSRVFLYYSISIAAIVIRELLNKFLLSFGRARTTLIVSIVGLLTNLTFSLLLVKVMGVAGLAFATTISLVLAAMLQIYFLRRHIGLNKISEILLFLSKLLIASVAVLVSITFLDNVKPDFGSLLNLAIGSVFMLGTYVFVLFNMKVKEIKRLFKIPSAQK